MVCITEFTWVEGYVTIGAAKTSSYKVVHFVVRSNAGGSACKAGGRGWKVDVRYMLARENWDSMYTGSCCL